MKLITHLKYVAMKTQLITLLTIMSVVALADGLEVKEDDSTIMLHRGVHDLEIQKEGFRFSVHRNGKQLLAAHEVAGLVLLKSPVARARIMNVYGDSVAIAVTNRIGIAATVGIRFYDNCLKFSVTFVDEDIRGSVFFSTQGVTPAFGLSDHAAYRKDPSTEVTGYSSNYFGALSDGKPSRLTSNFVISPANEVAFVNMEPSKKIVAVSEAEWKQGSVYVHSLPALYYFTGGAKEIYKDYLDARNREGYSVYKPKYEWFGVGWEAFGALGWETNHQTVRENVDTYLKSGYPLDWVVVGSGFWPNHEDRLLATTSFGVWDNEKYPDPEGFIAYYKQLGLKVILGLRIAFIPNGLFTQEGLEHGYFIQKDGKPRLFKVNFPKSDCYLLDGNNPEAVAWYLALCEKWLAYGIDGFKEDLFGYEIGDFDDDKLDAVNRGLMDKGVYVMGRNGYLGSPMDLHRYDDFNFNQNQDRGPVNGLAFSYSGFPYTYPDIVGGTGLAGDRFGKIDQEKLRIYLMRNAQYASLNPAMSFGFGVWQLQDDQVAEVCLDAAKRHHALQPYIFDAALKAYETGFPYPLTPLPLAFEDDTVTFDRENNQKRGYQWMIGESLMAYPLYGDDYDTTDRRDVYLPQGVWIDYDGGDKYEGPMMLKNFEIPVDKTPLFVGGKGFVVEQVENTLQARLYDVGFAGHITFRHKDGLSRSVIDIRQPPSRKSIVMDVTTGKKIRPEWERHALQFAMEVGHHYVIE